MLGAARLLFGLGCVVSFSVPYAKAQEPSQPQASSSTRVYNESTQRGAALRVRVPKMDRVPTLDDVAAMKANDWVRKHMARLSNFVQSSPFDGKPATEMTFVWLGRTDSTLYAVFICYDHHLDQLRSHLSRRENITSDDMVSLWLDPFQDRRRGLLFQVNPEGVQADANWTEPGSTDYSYDLVWNSEARRTSLGWIAIMEIPFRSIRSRAKDTQWGVVVNRSLPRNSETSYWPRVTPSISGLLTQEGAILGMEGASSHNIQINPYLIGHKIKQLNQNDPNNPFFSNRNFSGTAGGDIKAVVKDSIVLDGTINPDFSQVESDQPQFAINQRYALYYPELRPFFLENSSYFESVVTQLYTRTIVNPEFGARATGKIQHTNIGFLAIDDRAPGIYVAPTDPLKGKRAVTVASRVTQDLGPFSNVGLMYVQRTLDGGSNRTGGADFNWRMDRHWTLQGGQVFSSTHRRDGTYGAGPARRFVLTRSGRSFYLQEQFRDFSQNFQTDAGYVSVPRVRQNNVQMNLHWYPTGPTAKRLHVQSYGLDTNLRFAWDRRWRRVFRYTTDDFYVALARGTSISAVFVGNSDTLRPEDYAALPRESNFAENKGGIAFHSAPIPELSMNVQAYHGATVNYNPVSGAPPTLLTDNTVNAAVTLQPISRLTVDNTYLLDRADEASTHDHVYESQTMRAKINYQFSRPLSLRAIVQYSSVMPNNDLSALARTKDVSTQVLFTWLPHPGTAIYAGYNSNLQNLSHDLCTRLPSGDCDTTQPILPRGQDYLNDGREFFVKASYLLRF